MIIRSFYERIIKKKKPQLSWDSDKKLVGGLDFEFDIFRKFIIVPLSGGDVKDSNGHVLTLSGTSCSNSDFVVLYGTSVSDTFFCQSKALVFFAVLSHFYPSLMCTS